MRAPACDGDGSAVCARVGGLVLRARPEPETLKPCEPLPVGMDRVRLRRAGVLLGVGFQREHRRVEHRACHRLDPGMRRSRPGGRALWRTRSAGSSVRRGPLCAAALPMRARVRTRAGTRLRGALGVGTAGWRGGSIHASEYIYVCVCVTRLHIHYPFICMCENRPGLCMRVRVCNGDGSAVCARCGGLVLRARPEPETLNRASRARRRGPRAASARSHSSRCRRSTRTSARGTPRVSPRCPMYAPLPARADAHYGGRARPGFDAARAILRGGTADARARAHMCRHSLARGLGCRYGRPEGRIDTCIRVYMCLRVCVTRLHIHYPFIYICENRSGWVMYACTSVRW